MSIFDLRSCPSDVRPEARRPSTYKGFFCAVLCCVLSKNMVEFPRRAGNGKRVSPPAGGRFLPPDLRKGGLSVSTSEIFQLCLVIIGVCSLFIQANNSKKK